MGQVSLPVLNRTGYSMFWQSVWEDKFNFNRSLKEDYLFNLFFSLFLFGKISSRSTFFLKSFFDKSLLVNQHKFWSSYKNYTDFYIKLLKIFKIKKKFPYFLLKLWIIRVQSWVILLLSFYIPPKAKIFQNVKSNNSLTSNHKKKSQNDSLFLTNTLFYNYLFFVNLKYNKNFLKNNLIERFVF